MTNERGYALLGEIPRSLRLRQSPAPGLLSRSGGLTALAPNDYQLDLTTPGKRPSCAHSRRTLRDSPKSRYTPLERPVNQQRLR